MASNLVLSHRILTEKGFQLVGHIVAEMQESGTPQAQIDRWLQGLDYTLRRQARA